MDRRRSASPVRQHRTRRITRACDRCHKSNTKCAPGPDPSTCGPCFEFGEPCTYDRPVKRRGPAAGTARVGTSRRRSSQTQDRWTYEPVTSADQILRMIEGYRTIVYPIFPLFHWPTLMRDVRAQKYTQDREFYVVVMAACAIVSARLRHGVELPLPPLSSSLLSSEDYYRLAVEAFPTSLNEATTFNHKRAKALLAIACLQHGDAAELSTHLGDYGTLSLNDGFYDETRWPAGLTEIDVQERRRLFWSTYTLEIFAAITYTGLVRHRQSQCNVLYPAEVHDDEDITEEDTLRTDPFEDSFLHGWNFTTDLYCVLEHLVDRSRSRRLQRTSPITEMFQPTLAGLTAEAIQQRVEAMHANLPAVFRTVPAMTGNSEKDIFGFQAANIIVTLQTVKMMLAGLEEFSIDRRCAIAGQLLDALAAVPTAYIAAISAPMLQHLASVGHLLGTVIQHPLSQWSFLQVRNVLLAFANLISGLETVLSITSDISTRLKAHVDVIDEKMKSAATEAAAGQVFHSAYADRAALLPPPIAPANPPEPPTNDWSFAFSPDLQEQLQSDLTTAWPLDLGGNSLFGFLGDLQYTDSYGQTQNSL